jgi:hypothetical protein
MAHSGSTLVHGPVGVHHRTALVVVALAAVILATAVLSGLARTMTAPVVIDTPPAATAAPWVRAGIQSEYVLHIADHGMWGVGARHPVAHVPSTADRIRAGIQSEHVLAMAVEDRWNDPFPAVTLADRLDSGYLKTIATAGRWGASGHRETWPQVQFLDRFESGYLRELAATWGS